MLKGDLEKCKEKHILTSFYSDRDDTDSFSVGYIQGISDKYVLTESISKYGNYDGFDLRLLNRAVYMKKNLNICTVSRINRRLHRNLKKICARHC